MVMQYRVRAKQENSKMCLVCGLKNPFGLQASFYELENEELLALFTPTDEYQSYPGRLHGGIATTILDETIGRAIMIYYDDLWGVTIDMHVRFRKPIPLNEEIRVIARITKDRSRVFEGSGEILLSDGSVAVEGQGKYIKLPLEKIADFDAEEQEWRVVPTANDPEVVEF
jgi:acyl-coenzyme A thioesterase PaaI-like protein